MSNSKVLDAAKHLDAWIDRNGWAGYDPYDVREVPWLIRLTDLGSRSRGLEIVREIVFELLKARPEAARKILGVGPAINAKGMGLLARSYLDLSLAHEEETYLEKALDVLRWLEKNSSKGYHGVCWGYPFDWQSTRFIPKGTPSGVVTSTVGDAFWSCYRYSGDNRYLDICRSICDFFLNDLNIDRVDSERICFSYTPLTNDHVHNANLFVADFLTRMGRETGNTTYLEYGRRALNYTLSHQGPDGSFDYLGPPDETKGWVDHYHTGFVLRALHSIYRTCGGEHICEALRLGCDFYVNNLFEGGRVPRLLPDRIYPIDIHSCSEAVLCLTQLSELFPEALERAVEVAGWTIQHMQDSDGHFYYAVHKSRFTGRIYVSKIPYVRWGQAWMLRALSALALRLGLDEPGRQTKEAHSR